MSFVDFATIAHTYIHTNIQYVCKFHMILHGELSALLSQFCLLPLSHSHDQHLCASVYVCV